VEPTAAAITAVDDETAALILEPVQGESGVYVLSDDVLRAAREACDRHGAPVCGPKLADVLAPGGHGYSFAGGPVQCCAALAVLDILGDPALQAGVLELGERLAEGLREMPGVVEVRGRASCSPPSFSPTTPREPRRSCAEPCSTTASSSTRPGRRPCDSCPR
jgi:acetylornithine/succinyldiaminopimelate/putrescine aminotransferase